MKIAIVGGSAASTPALFLTPEFRSLAGRVEVTLIGRSEDRLRAVRRAIDVLTGSAIPVECATDPAALDGAALVLLQARYGGYEGRARDELFPLKHGLCGDEGLGPGGLAAAWRSWRPLSRALESIAARCPRATVLLMTAPLSLLVRCARAAFPALDVTGICELPWATLVSICATLNVRISEVAFSYAGVNHLGWFDELRAGGLELITRYAQTRRGNAFPPAHLIESCAAIPLSYLRLHYEAGAVLRRQRAQRPRALGLQAIQARALQAFASAGRDEIIDALAQRPTPWYAQAVAPFVAATAGQTTSTIFFLSARNDGYLPFLAPDDTLEQPFAVAGGARRRLLRSGDLSQPLARTLTRFVEYERLAARAVLTDQRAACATVLAQHPWLTACSDVAALAADVMTAV